MTWMQLDPDDFWEPDEVAVMGLEAAGLLWFMLCRSWKTGGMKDDPELWRRLTAGRTRRFDALWPVVRGALSQVEGELRCDWLEEKRSQVAAKLRNDAQRQKQKRLSKRQNAERPSDVTRTSVSRGEEKRGEERRDTPPSPRKRGATPKLPPDWWLPVFAEFPDLDTPEAREAFVSLLRSRTDRGDSRWTPKRLRSKLREFAGFDGAVFARSVALTESNGWKGCFPPKPGSAQNGAMDWLYGGKAEPRTVDVKGEVR